MADLDLARDHIVSSTLQMPRASALVVEFCVEMRKARRHSRRFHRSDLLIRQISGQFNPALAPRQAQIVLLGYQDGARAAVLGDDHRLAHGGLLIGAEVLRHVGGSDG
jgi:hypothetical protein